MCNIQEISFSAEEKHILAGLLGSLSPSTVESIIADLQANAKGAEANGLGGSCRKNYDICTCILISLKKLAFLRKICISGLLISDKRVNGNGLYAIL